MATQNRAAGQTEQEPKTVRGLIESNKFQLAVASVLPSHLTPDRFVRIAIAATTRTPKLAECDPNTVLQCLMTLSQFGLEPDGRNAHLIPFWNSQKKSYDCQLIIDYKGLVALAKRSGQVSYVHADAVCENDVFEYNKGQVVKHEINFKSDRGKPYAYYAMVRFKDGTEQAECMTIEEIASIRSRSRAKDSGPWVTDKGEMSKKTVFRRLSKWIELSPEFRDAIEADADKIEDLRFEQALPISRPQIKRLRTNTVEPTSEPEPVETPLESGGETQTTGEPSSTGKPEAATAATSPKKLKKRATAEPSQGQAAGPNESAMIVRLVELSKSKDDLVAVAKKFDALKDEQGWSDIGEEGFAELLFADNWKLVEQELKA